jgi:hypothetical protein
VTSTPTWSWRAPWAPTTSSTPPPPPPTSPTGPGHGREPLGG